MRWISLILFLHIVSASTAQSELQGFNSLLMHFRNPAMSSFDHPNTMELFHQLSSRDGFYQQQTTLLTEYASSAKAGWTQGLLVNTDYKSAHQLRLRFGFLGRDCRPVPTHNVERKSFAVSLGVRLDQLPDGTNRFLGDINFGYARVIRNFEFGIGTSTLSSTLINNPEIAPSLNFHGNYSVLLNRKYDCQLINFLSLDIRGQAILRSGLSLNHRKGRGNIAAYWQSNHMIGSEITYQIMKCKKPYQCWRIHIGASFFWNYHLDTYGASVLIGIPFSNFARND